MFESQTKQLVSSTALSWSCQQGQQQPCGSLLSSAHRFSNPLVLIISKYCYFCITNPLGEILSTMLFEAEMWNCPCGVHNKNSFYVKKEKKKKKGKKGKSKLNKNENPQGLEICYLFVLNNQPTKQLLNVPNKIWMIKFNVFEQFL